MAVQSCVLRFDEKRNYKWIRQLRGRALDISRSRNVLGSLIFYLQITLAQKLYLRQAPVTPYLATSHPSSDRFRTGSLDCYGKSGLPLFPNFSSPPVTVVLPLQREEGYSSLDPGFVEVH